MSRRYKQIERALLWVLTAAVASTLVACGSSSKAQKDDEVTDAKPAEWPKKDKAEPRNLTPTTGETETVLIEGATVMTAAGKTLEEG
ncbi:MAG: hypothetical protein ABEN55_24080, partial [Bradymonadaceae bacterium]